MSKYSANIDVINEEVSAFLYENIATSRNCAVVNNGGNVGVSQLTCLSALCFSNPSATNCWLHYVV